MRHSTSAPIDEQALAAHLPAEARKRLGAYFTPLPVVDQVLDAVTRVLPSGPLAFVDPACGAGAFLARAAERFPQAKLYGLELDGESLALARARVKRATLRSGDALEPGALEALLEGADARCEVWIGNPPYNGTSQLLKDGARWRRLVEGVEQLRGQSLREDYVFFLLRALERLGRRSGALAFVTSASLLSSWAHAPVRKRLAEQLALREVHALGRGVFRDTRVATCFTVFTTRDLGEGLHPAPPDWLFVPGDAGADAIDARGVRLSQLVPVSLPGLKTRFDELLVDDDRERLVERMKRFARGQAIDVPERCEAKLAALPRVPFDERAVRRFIHPRGRRAWCYIDRRLIPRGDHRFRGEWDPHACDVKLVFNVRELPLHAQVIDEPGCVTAYQHSRFAPLWVPASMVDGNARPRANEPLVANLSIKAPDARQVFEEIARQVMGREVQELWAPVYGTGREVPIVLPGMHGLPRAGR